MKTKPAHGFVKQPDGKCVWCESPREAHTHEYIRDEDGLRKVAIEREKQ